MERETSMYSHVHSSRNPTRPLKHKKKTIQQTNKQTRKNGITVKRVRRAFATADFFVFFFVYIVNSFFFKCVCATMSVVVEACVEREKKTQVFKKKRTTRDSPRGVASQASDSEVLHKKNKKTIQTERLGSRRCSNRSSEQSSSVVEILFFFSELGDGQRTGRR